MLFEIFQYFLGVIALLMTLTFYVKFTIIPPMNAKKRRKRAYEFVYIVRQDTGFSFSFSKRYKIGKAKDYERRIKQLQTANPYGMKIIKIFKTKKPFELEKQLHRAFKKQRVKGEWFSFNPIQLFFALRKARKLQRKINKK